MDGSRLGYHRINDCLTLEPQARSRNWIRGRWFSRIKERNHCRSYRNGVGPVLPRFVGCAWGVYSQKIKWTGASLHDGMGRRLGSNFDITVTDSRLTIPMPIWWKSMHQQPCRWCIRSSIAVPCTARANCLCYLFPLGMHAIQRMWGQRHEIQYRHQSYDRWVD